VSALGKWETTRERKSPATRSRTRWEASVIRRTGRPTGVVDVLGDSTRCTIDCSCTSNRIRAAESRRANRAMAPRIADRTDQHIAAGFTPAITACQPPRGGTADRYHQSTGQQYDRLYRFGVDHGSEAASVVYSPAAAASTATISHNATLGTTAYRPERPSTERPQRPRK